MIQASQGDIIKVNGYKNQLFLITSKNSYIKATGTFHICPIISNKYLGPTHIEINGIKGTEGLVACEQLKLIDPSARSFTPTDHISYYQLMEVSDTIQGIFEYD